MVSQAFPFTPHRSFHALLCSVCFAVIRDIDTCCENGLCDHILSLSVISLLPMLGLKLNCAYSRAQAGLRWARPVCRFAVFKERTKRDRLTLNGCGTRLSVLASFNVKRNPVFVYERYSGGTVRYDITGGRLCQYLISKKFWQVVRRQGACAPGLTRRRHQSCRSSGHRKAG